MLPHAISLTLIEKLKHKSYKIVHRVDRCALRDADFSLSAMLAEGRAIELSEKQATDIENIREAEVNIASKRFQKTTTQRSQFKKATSNSTVNREKSTCYCCGGNYPHPQNKPCAAKGKICNYCQKSGHFAKVCKAKMHNNSMQTNCVTNTNAVTTTNVTSDSDDGYVFSAKNEAIVHNSLPTCVVQIEGEPIRMTIDSGASVNIVTLSIRSDDPATCCLNNLYRKFTHTVHEHRYQ